MSRAKLILVAAVLALAAGCMHECGKPAFAERNDRHLVASIVDEQVAAAVMRQRLIGPQHFYTGSAVLNGLGVRDLLILSAQYRRDPGVLHVVEDPEADALYDARVNAIRTFMQKEGVAVARMKFDADWAGGDGEPAEAAASNLSDHEGPPPGAIPMPAPGPAAGPPAMSNGQRDGGY